MPVPIPILLTATVRPGATTMTARSNPNERLRDYVAGLGYLMQRAASNQLVFCENSHHDLSILERLVAEFRRPGLTVEFISFDGQGYDPTLGKGFGELNIIEHAIQRSSLLSTATHFIKLTGRYVSVTPNELMRQFVADHEPDIICELQRDLTYVDARVFLTSKRFITEYLLPRREEINDSRGVYLEHVFARAVHMAISEGARWRPPHRPIAVTGISGTTNSRLHTNAVRGAVRAAAHLLKRKLNAR